ncbi:MAG: hypothetical protein ACYDA6_10040 [Solirubrobacteraceae bacterium]
MPVHFRPFSLLAAVAAALLSAPTGASASRTIAPPGNSGVGQYVEVIPGSGGPAPVGSSPKQGPVLSASARHRLEASGPAGSAVAAFVQRTGTPRAGHAAAHHGAPAPGHGTLVPSAIPVRAASSAAGELGWGLPAALGAIVLLGLGILITRRRAG